jgi:hypothetical protein
MDDRTESGVYYPSPSKWGNRIIIWSHVIVAVFGIGMLCWLVTVFDPNIVSKQPAPTVKTNTSKQITIYVNHKVFFSVAGQCEVNPHSTETNMTINCKTGPTSYKNFNLSLRDSLSIVEDLGPTNSYAIVSKY